MKRRSRHYRQNKVRVRYCKILQPQKAPSIQSRHRQVGHTPHKSESAKSQWNLKEGASHFEKAESRSTIYLSQFAQRKHHLWLVLRLLGLVHTLADGSDRGLEYRKLD